MTAAPANPQEVVVSAAGGHVPGGAAAASAGEQAFRARRVPVRFAVAGVRGALPPVLSAKRARADVSRGCTPGLCALACARGGTRGPLEASEQKDGDCAAGVSPGAGPEQGENS
jgi:hypothetical protein